MADAGDANRADNHVIEGPSDVSGGAEDDELPIGNEGVNQEQGYNNPDEDEEEGEEEYGNIHEPGEPFWFFMAGGEQKGPLPESQLKEMISRNKMFDLLIWRGGMSDWQPLATVPHLMPGYEDPNRKRKRDPTHVIPPEVRTWLSQVDEGTLVNSWTMACELDELLHGQHGIRDRLLLSYIERDSDLEGDPEDFVLSDEFFRDVIDVQGPRQFWKMLYPGNEEAMLDLLFHAAKYDVDIYQGIRVSHSIQQIKSAIAQNDEEAVLRIIRNDPKVLDCADPKGKTPLHVAIEASKSGIARTLLDFASDDGTVQGADPNDPDNAGNTPLHIAAESGSVEMARLLLDSGADPNLQNDAGEYGAGNWSVRQAGESGLRPLTSLDKTPLHVACEQDDEEMVELLLQRGADPNIRDKAAMTAIHYAIDENSESAVNLLLSRGADPTLGNNEIGMDSTPLHTALSRGRHNIALLLLKTGRFDVNQPGGGWLPLHLAARRGSHQAVKMLLDQGADPVATDDSGRTAKKLAEVNNRAECVKLLEDAELQMSSQPADSNV